MTQHVAPSIADDSDTARHQDHITVHVAENRVRYAFDASRDSLQDDWTLGLIQVPTRCQQAAVALVGTLLHHLSASVRAEATRMLLGNHQRSGRLHRGALSRPGVRNPGGGQLDQSRTPGLALLAMGLYNPIECPRAAHVQPQSPPGNVFTLRTAKLRHRDTGCLTVPHTMPWHRHDGPHHPFRDSDDPWPAAVRECLNQCPDEHLHYRRRQQGAHRTPRMARRPGPPVPHHQHTRPPRWGSSTL